MITRDVLRAQVLCAAWDDLIPHMTRGGLMLVAPSEDLLDAALAVANDDREAVLALLARGGLVKAEASHAEHFETEPPPRFQLVIVQPYVLAQHIVEPAPEQIEPTPE